MNENIFSLSLSLSLPLLFLLLLFVLVDDHLVVIETVIVVGAVASMRLSLVMCCDFFPLFFYFIYYTYIRGNETQLLSKKEIIKNSNNKEVPVVELSLHGLVKID